MTFSWQTTEELVAKGESSYFTCRFTFQEIKECLFSIRKIGDVNDIYLGAKVCFESKGSLRIGEVECSGFAANVEERRYRLIRNEARFMLIDAVDSRLVLWRESQLPDLES